MTDERELAAGNEDGARFFRGLLFAAAISLPIWGVIGAALWLVLS